MTKAFALDATPREARWYVEIIIGRDVTDGGHYGGNVIGTETESIDGYTDQEDRPTVKQINSLVPEGWKKVESTVTETGH